jgi:hypothetical protein
MKGIKHLSAGVVVNVLAAVVRYKRSEPGRKVGIGSEVEVRYAGRLLGKATLGGRYSEAQALAEFRRNPRRFGWEHAVPADSADVTITLGPLNVAHFSGAPVATPEAGLAHFQAHPQAFERLPGWDIAASMGLIRAA